MSVLVTDGEQRATLAVVRALGRAGLDVTVGSAAPISLAASSRFCNSRVQYPSPAEHGHIFQTKLLEEVQTRKYKVVFPITDITMTLVAQMRDALEPFVRIPIPAAEAISSVQDKRLVLLKAHEIGIPYPETWMLDDTDDLNAIAAMLRYPVVLKPRVSWLRRNVTWISGQVQYAYDPEDLKAKYEKSHSSIPNPLIQERIHGEGIGVFLLLWNGELKAAFCHRRLREKPPWGGVSVLRESMPYDVGIVDKSFRLLQAFGWQGPAMVEFKVDNRDGQLKLMEVNGRFWGSLQLALDSGVNFPLLYYRLAMGEPTHSQFEYKVGVRSRWLLGDLDQLLIRWKHSGQQSAFPGDERSKLRASLDFMKFYEPNLHYEVFRFEDPAPGWHECKSYIQALMRCSASRQEKARAH